LINLERIGYSIIGAGVVGLAIAEALSINKDADIIVFESHDKYGQEISSRNSEVIHAGIYYPPGSLKSRLCLEGNRLLYELCEKEGIKYDKCGKLIVSTSSQEADQIIEIFDQAQKIGVPGLQLLNGKEALSLEPGIIALNAIYSSTTGIIDSHGLMSCLYQKAHKNGTMFAFGNEVVDIAKYSDGYIIRTNKNEEILSKCVINCAGLNSDKIAKIAGFDIELLKYRLHYCKGDYFSLAGSIGKLKHLVYPPPNEKGYGLGVHATLDLQGGIRFGPDATYVSDISYDIDQAKRHEFYNAAKKYLPWIKEEDLAPDTSGIRPKLQGPNDGFRDFIIKEETENGYPGFINLIGIESPGLTSALAIGEYVAKIISVKS
jgi:L-2-hydroxyglutarate oxidase LhgO